MRLNAIADCCTLTNVTDGSDPWVIHVEHDGAVQLRLMEDEEVEDAIVLPATAEHIIYRGEDNTWGIDWDPDNVRWYVEWTKFAGLYRDVSGYIWAIPDIVGVRDSDIGSIVKAGNTYWLLLIGGYDPRVARLSRGVGPITSERHHVPSQGIKPVPRELAKLVREVLDHPAPCLLWKENP